MSCRLRIELVLVALACLGPLAGAYVLYYFGEPAELPRIANEQRMLLEPAVPLPPLPGREPGGAPAGDLWSRPVWSLIYASTSACDTRCRDQLIGLRQVHAALGRDRHRVRPVYLGTAADVGAIGDSVVATGRLDVPAGEPLLELLDSIGLAPGAGRLYVADPHGNLVLSYPAGTARDGLHDDLKRLLRVSRIG